MTIDKLETDGNLRVALRSSTSPVQTLNVNDAINHPLKSEELNALSTNHATNRERKFESSATAGTLKKIRIIGASNAF